MLARALFRLSARSGLAAAFLLVFACTGSEPLGPSGLEAPRGLPGPVAAVAPTNFWATKAPMITPRYGAASAAVNGVIYVIGGTRSGAGLIPETTPIVEAYTPGSDTWAAKAPLPDPRGLTNGAGVINGRVYVAGGQNYSGQPTNTLFAYNPGTNTWTTRAPMPVGGGCGVTGVIAGKLYVFVPGCSTPASGTSGAFMRYDPATDRWTSLPGTFPRRFASAAVVGGKFYMAAGQGPGSGGLYDHVLYDPATNAWRGAGSMTSGSGVYGAPGAAAGGLYYSIGGFGSFSSSPIVLVRAYDPGSLTWTNRASLRFARALPATATVNGKIYVIGGLGTVPVAYNEVYTPGDVWVTKSSMPSPRGGLAATVANGKLYAIGGFDGTAKLAVNQMYTPGTDRWTTRAPLPQPRMDANGAGLINGVIYVAGGHNGGLMQRTLYAYNVSANTWSTKAAMPAVGGRGASAVIGGKLYVLTGADASFTSAKRLDRYDPATNTWRTLAPPISIHDQPATAVINGKFYVVGGLGTGGTNTGALEAYDPALNGWTALAPMPTPRRAATAVVLNGLLYVIGGLGSANTFPLRTVEVYNPATNAWRPGTPISIPGFTWAAGVINGAIYVVGGYGNSNAMSFTQVYTP